MFYWLPEIDLWALKVESDNLLVMPLKISFDQQSFLGSIFLSSLFEKGSHPEQKLL